MNDDSRWESLKLRLIDETKRTARRTLENNRSSGMAIITVHMLVDFSGTPLAWVVPEGKRIEPSKNAASLLRTLIEVL